MTPIDPTTRRIPVRGLTLSVAEAGPEDGPLTVLLHGFPETWWGWRHQIGPLAAAGLRVVAPDQRGYGLSSRPEGIAAYHLDRLADDVTGLADALGHDRFRLVGHDWGGLVAWWVAARHPDRLERLAILNAPHPDVFGAYARRHPTQALRSVYVGLFQLPGLPEALLRVGDCAALRRALTNSSRPGAFSPHDLDLYAAAWRRPGAITAMLNWYRALRLRRGRRRDRSGRRSWCCGASATRRSNAGLPPRACASASRALYATFRRPPTGSSTRSRRRSAKP